MRKKGWSRRAGAMMVLLLGLVLLPGLACAKGPAGTVLVLGDSLSAAHNIPADAGWVSLLQQRVSQQSKTPARIVNASMSGETTAGALTRLPGSTVWWPGSRGETEPGVTVLAFQAPLLFANADSFKRQLLASIDTTPAPGLIVLEGSAIVEIDYSAAQTLREVVGLCQQQGIVFVIARLGSVRAMQALERFGIAALLGPDGTTHSVQQAVDHYRTRGTP